MSKYRVYKNSTFYEYKESIEECFSLFKIDDRYVTWTGYYKKDRVFLYCRAVDVFIISIPSLIWEEELEKL